VGKGKNTPEEKGMAFSRKSVGSKCGGGGGVLVREAAILIKEARVGAKKKGDTIPIDKGQKGDP